MSIATKALSITVQPSWDPEVLDWFNVRVPANGGSVPVYTRLAANAFMLSIKSAGLRMKIYRLNLFAGADFVHGNNTDLGAVQVPLIKDKGNALDVSVAPGASWGYAETGTSGGLRALSPSYLDTGLVPMTAWPDNTSGHQSLYVRTAANENSVSGSQRGTSPYTTESLSPGPMADGSIYAVFHDFNQAALFYDSGGRGMYSVSRTSTTTKAAYKNATLGKSSASSPATTHTNDRAMLIFACRFGSGIGNFTTKTLAGYSIGLGLTATEVTDFYNAWQAFQSALGRAV